MYVLCDFHVLTHDDWKEKISEPQGTSRTKAMRWELVWRLTLFYYYKKRRRSVVYEDGEG